MRRARACTRPDLPVLARIRRAATRVAGIRLLALGVALQSPGRGAAAAAISPDLGWHAVGRWAQPQGLPQDTVFALHQSAQGYLWLGTRSGAARFDGATFTTYDNRSPTQLRDNEVWSVADGADGSVWIATYGGGLTEFRGGRFTTYTTDEGLVNNFVSAVCSDRAGTIWAATDGGVSAFRDGHFTNFTVNDGLGSKTAWCLCEAGEGGIWVGTKNGIVNRIADGKVLACPMGPEPPTSEIRAIQQDRGGALWVGTTMQGLFRWKDGVVTRFSEKDGLPAVRVTALHEDASGTLWVGTTGGLVRYKDGRFIAQRLRDKSSRADSILSLTSDREGSLWVGTADQGVVCLRPNLFATFTTDDGLPDEFATGIVQDDRGDMLIGTRKGVSLVRQGRITAYTERHGLPPLSVWGITRDRDQTIWLATEHGVYCSRRNDRNAAREHLFHKFGEGVELMRDISARLVMKDRTGVVWIGTTIDGLVRCDEGGYKVYTTKDGLANNAVRGLCEGPDGALWIATRGGGLTRLRDGKFSVYTRKDGLVSDIIQTMYMDADGTLWLGTRQGLGRFSAGKFTSYTVADGLFVNYLSGIGEDHHGNLWMSSAKGVFRVSKAQLKAFADGTVNSITSVAYGSEHGMSSTVGAVGVYPTVFTSDDGRVWFATFNGVNVIDPWAISVNRLAPPVHVAEVTVDRRFFEPGTAITAPPGRGDLSFRYSGVSFVAPEKMRFKYQLEGYDQEWVDAGGRREAFYSNIAPGTYRFRVIAANSDGVWNETGATVSLTLQPHLVQTGWFRGLLGLAALGVVLGAVRYRGRRLQRRAEELRRQNVELERRIAERTAELQKSYEDLRASEYFYHSLVESMPQVILRKDAGGRITYANSAYGELIGRPLAEIVSRPESDFHPPEIAAKLRADDLRIMQTRQPIEYETTLERDGGRKRYLQVKKVPLYGDHEEPIGVQVLFWDMSAFRETEEKLRAAQRELIEISRFAGIAEVATGVLHNLGNALNSVNISATVVAEHLQKLKIQNLRAIAGLISEQGDRVADFLAHDPRGRKVPEYLTLLAEELHAERNIALHEAGALRASIDHIKEIVAAQEANARVTGISEVISASELMEYALRISDAALSRAGITVSREFTATTHVDVQRGKALQILGNLIQNAKDALVESGRPDKQLTVGFRPVANRRVQFYVADNGAGIAPENRSRVFEFGFTTKKTGHGFGLHSSALAAAELEGSLTVESAGVGKGATFVLELPACDPAG